MRTIQYRVSYEKMISRLPSLFAYLDSDEFGEVSLHKATDSIDGCYAKIIENIKIPVGCGCKCPYYTLSYMTESFYNTQNVNIIKTEYEYEKLTDEEKENYTPSSYPIIISVEDYNNIETQEEKAFYEPIYLDINDNQTYISEDEYNALEIKEEETYTYRTLIDYYYEYKNYTEVNVKFKNFIERGIGKIKITDMSIFDNLEDKEKFKNLSIFELVPEFVYLATARRLYNEMMKMKKQCEFYEKMKERGEYDKHLCCLCEKFEKMGGELFTEYLGKLIPIADTIAQEYFLFADTNNSMNLEFSVDLTSSYSDMGIITPYAPQWIPYKKYTVGDKVVYNGIMYVCKSETSGKKDGDDLRVTFDKDKWDTYDGFLSNINENNFETKTLNENNVWYDGSANRHRAKGSDVGKTVLNYEVLNINNTISLPVKNAITDSKLKDLRRFATYLDQDNIASTPEEGTDWLFYYRKGDVLNIETQNDEFGNILILSKDKPKPAEHKTDCLDAYGDYIEDISYNAENYSITFTYRIGVHLKVDSVFNEHSVEKQQPIITYDDDGNKLYKWLKLTYDENDVNSGIKYQETYNYLIDSDLDKLINGDIQIEDENNELTTVTFEDYVNGDYDIALGDYKFEFITYNNMFSFDKTIAYQEIVLTSILTDLDFNRKNYEEFTETELFKEDYLNGVTYSPTKDIEVKIERGSTSVFDKHIALSEIKTLEDLENYKNGSFFTIDDA